MTDTPPIWALWQSGHKQKPLLSERNMKAGLEFVKKHLKDSQTVRNKILWSDESDIEPQSASVLSCLKQGAAHHLPNTILMIVEASCCLRVFQQQGLGD